MHAPEQSILDYKAQREARNAAGFALFFTVLTGLLSSFLFSTIAVKLFIGTHTRNFFPGYVPFRSGLHAFPLYSPYAIYHAYTIFYQYPMMQHTFYFAAAGILLTTLSVGIWQFIASGKKQERIYKNDLHGSAHWATEKEVLQMSLLPDKKSKGSSSLRICYVGGYPDEKGQLRYLMHAGAEHVIAFAPTRSGKGVGLVLPTLLGGWKESVVVHDIKGENYLLTAGWRRSIGQRVLKFNPGFGLADDEDVGNQKAQCCHFNPLEEVRISTPFEVKDVMNIATMIVDPDGKGLNDHWQKTGFALLTSVILHVLYAEPDKTMRGVAAYLNDPELVSVDDAFTKMMQVEHDPEGKYHWTDQRGNPIKVHPAISLAAKEMLNKADNEKSGVISTMMSFLSLYRDPIVAEWTEYSDFKIIDLQDCEDPVSLYLVTSPEDKNRLKPLIRLVLNLIASKFTAADRLIEKKGRMESVAKHPLLLLLDEFPSLGKMDVFQDTIAFLAGYNVKLYLIAQDKSQLEDEGHAYGKSGAQIIINNCHVRVIYAPNEITTAEWVSKMLGKKTVAMENTNQSFEGGFIPSQKGQSRSISYQGRELLTADEVLRLRGPEKRGSDIVKAGDMLILVAGFAPVYGQQILYFKDGVFLNNAQVPAPLKSDFTSTKKDYKALFGETAGVREAPEPEVRPNLDVDDDYTQEEYERELVEAEKRAGAQSTADGGDTANADEAAADETGEAEAAEAPASDTANAAAQSDAGVVEEQAANNGVDADELNQVAGLLQSMPMEILTSLREHERTAAQADRASNKDDFSALNP